MRLQGRLPAGHNEHLDEWISAMPTVEICIDDHAGIAACISGGADRIELCAALDLGGLTPSIGLMQSAATGPLPCYAMIRPRAGDFCYSPAELDVMVQDIDAARRAGLDGVVIGAATADRQLDLQALDKLSAACNGMGRTLHRVIDTLEDPLKAIDIAIDLGFEHILSSGGAPTACDGQDCLKAMQTHARDRIDIIAGAGIRADNAKALVKATGIRSLHASCSLMKPENESLKRLGFCGPTRRRTGAVEIRALKTTLMEGCT